MLQRTIVAVFWIPVLAYVVLFEPPVVMLAALCLLAGVGGMELQRCVSGVKHGELVGMSAIAAVFTVTWYYERSGQISLLFVLEALIFFGYAIFKGGEVKFQQTMAALFGSFAIGYSFASFLRLEASGVNRAYLLLPFILSFGCDTFAYLVGCSVGKHKLAPRVSPNKTVEGAIGGLAGNVACGLAFAWVVNRWLGGGALYGRAVILALACGVVAQIGDLSFSLIKREFGVKDYGRLFLAHGGVLDRFDSVLFVAPVVEIILILVR